MHVAGNNKTTAGEVRVLLRRSFHWYLE